jgi:hypothetical protein
MKKEKMGEKGKTSLFSPPKKITPRKKKLITPPNTT